MEKRARILVILLVGAALALPFLGRWLANPRADAGQVIELHGRMPESGGWLPDAIQAEVGVPLKLRLTSDDVMHSFALGQSDHEPLDIIPGEWVETTLVFDQPGQYTYYCTRWCGANHWRMRGVIEVVGASVGPTEISEGPLFLKLGLDLDAPHLAENTPPDRPAAERGEQWSALLPADTQDATEVQTSSPAQMWARLQAEPTLAKFDTQQIWDMVAFAYARLPGGQDLAQAGELYRQNCLACHGEQGKGDGVMVRDLQPMTDHSRMGHEATRPPDFSDPAVLLGASPALLEGKIIRGGMGTGMPNWGAILTHEQIQSLVLYLYQFQMDLEVQQ